MDLQPYYQIVEAALENLGISPEEVSGPQKGQWSLWRDQLNILVDVWFIEREGRPYFQVMSPILELSKAHDRNALYREALEANDRFYGVGFTIYKEVLWLKTIRECTGLDAEEAYAAILRISEYGLEFRPFFQQKYQTP
jgi:hypothetical protein